MAKKGPTRHGMLMQCQTYLLEALHAAAADRGTDLSWIERERLVVAVAANRWAQAHRIETLVSVDDVERVEQRAIGHVDYAAKLALYVAELVVG